MDKKEFSKLIRKYLDGRANPEEEERLFRYYDYLQRDRLPWDESELGDQAEVKVQLFSKIVKEINDRRAINTSYSSKYVVTWAIAASVIIGVVCIGFFSLREKRPTYTVHKAKPLINDIEPGGNKAVLTLADGSTILLDDARNGIVSSQGQILVKKNKEGQLVYQVKSTDQAADHSLLNILETPSGGQYQLVLSDGSKVWLNARSSIKFPVAFTAKERVVEIHGEAYLEVAKDSKRPFKVKCEQQLVEVLGTHFNVNGYTDESNIKTTLLEGSVRVSHGGSTEIIRPGQQTRLSRNTNRIEVMEVEAEDAVAWKNGYFLFDDEDISSIMRKIARWYDVEVVFQDRNINEKFGGMVSKFENVSQVLKVLEVTGAVHFKIEGRRVIVMQ